jgi:triphosphoribosyl-dephospho-CoA synthase
MTATAFAQPAATDLRMRALQAFTDACLLDVTALKPGNVGIHGAGHRMDAIDFVRSARAAGPAIVQDSRGVGERIHRAVSATHAAVRTNTNLGIVLLAAPLVHSVLQSAMDRCRGSLSALLAETLAALTVDDATRAFAAIRLANPGGLGEVSSHDVRAVARVSLLEAMRAAADRDSIARQYVSGYAEVVGIGVERLRLARARGHDLRWASTEAYLAFVSSIPDSHVARKFGVDTAEQLRQDARPYAEAACRSGPSAAVLKRLRDWDTVLKQRGLNPGTSADLMVASALWCMLEDSFR